jgi:hypothetical protein
MYEKLRFSHQATPTPIRPAHEDERDKHDGNVAIDDS